MTDELRLRRKWTFRAHGKQVIFIKKSREHAKHVLMKALLWAMYLPDYPELAVEIHIGDRYKPDVVQLDAYGKPIFWAEAGSVSPKKIQSLLRRFPDTHFAIAKWAVPLDPVINIVSPLLQKRQRDAPFDMISFPKDSATRFIDQNGNIEITFADVTLIQLP